jgi:hypothetical protein
MRDQSNRRPHLSPDDLESGKIRKWASSGHDQVKTAVEGVRSGQRRQTVPFMQRKTVELMKDPVGEDAPQWPFE